MNEKVCNPRKTGKFTAKEGQKERKGKERKGKERKGKAKKQKGTSRNEKDSRQIDRQIGNSRTDSEATSKWVPAPHVPATPITVLCNVNCFGDCCVRQS